MKTVITVIVIVAILVFALKGSVKHMKGEGDCCGGGSGNKPKKVKAKHLEDPVIGQITLYIEGMTCEHCVNRVAEALNSIDGVSAKVNLHKKNATVSFDASGGRRDFMQRGGKSRLSGAFGLGHKINFTCLIVSTMILS